METFCFEIEHGRRLAWSETGAADGVPVLHCHGGLSCRLEITFADALCRRAGVRWIAPDRPGIGGSDAHPADSLLERARDLEALADHLGLERFAVSGWSAGGPHALACAALIPERVTRVIVMAGLAPLRGPRDIRALGMATDRFLFRVAPRSPRLAAAGLRPVRHAPFAMVHRSVATMLHAGPDGPALAPETADQTARALVEALRPGMLGTARDYQLLAGDWGFDPASINTPVSLWHGDRDELLPLEHSRRLAATLPQAELHPCAGVGHFLPRRRLETIWAEFGFQSTANKEPLC